MEKTKPFWRSVSFWLAICSALAVALEKLITGGVIPNEGWAAILLPILILIGKRGLVESSTVKGNALVEASKASPLPPAPPQG